MASGPVYAMVRTGDSYRLMRFDRKDWEGRTLACLTVPD